MLYFKVLAMASTTAAAPIRPCVRSSMKKRPTRWPAMRALAAGPGHGRALARRPTASASSARWKSLAERAADVGLLAQKPPSRCRSSCCRWRWNRPIARCCTSASRCAST
jgi:hypothetical protein